MVEVSLPVSCAAADYLREPEKRARLGVLVSVALALQASLGDLAAALRLVGVADDKRRTALRDAFADVQRAAADARLSPEEIERELDAWKRRKPSTRGA